ncbi:CidA/LrgA family protein [Bibersteinia trehalosi]|uniref:CidA/LrgA family protein n=1 Tax=Bibersteinia trehalosi TaxID=47735 RepID=UPI0040464447
MNNVLKKIGQFALSLAILLLMLWGGKGLNLIVPTIPEGIWGLLLLFFCLVSGVLKKAWILPTARIFNRYMPICFLPICVGIINYGDVLKAHFVDFILANMLSSALSLILIAVIAEKLSVSVQGKHK